MHIQFHGAAGEASQRAEKVLEERDEPIISDVHLIFGCMIAKRV